jgi:hypothetical protein
VSTRPVAKLLKCLVLMISPIFLLETIPNCKDCRSSSGGSSPSIKALWPDIDKLDEIRCKYTSIVHTHEVLLRARKSIALAENADRHSRLSGNKALLSDALRPSNIKSKGRRSGSMERKAT